MGEFTGTDPTRGRGTECGSFIIDGRGVILGFDRRMEGLTGWTATEIVGRTRDVVPLVVVPEDGLGRAGAPLDPESLRRHGGARSLETRLRCADGRILDVEAIATLASGSSGRVTVSVLRVLASTPGDAMQDPAGAYDALTGLNSKEVFLERLAAEIRTSGRTGRPVAVILCDVDKLRHVGDRFGRGAEETVLKKLAGILRATVRQDDLVARLAEDDFAILLPGIGRGSARQIAARLRSTVERFRFFALHESPAPQPVTLSLGAASFPADADNADDLLARSREALDEARSLGRNRVWCYTRRPRVPLRTPVFLDGAEPLLLGYTRDLSPSGLFVSTPAPIDIGMRCALSFPLPSSHGNVHVIGRVVRTVPLQDAAAGRDIQVPGMGVEFERFGPDDRRAIESFLFENEEMTVRRETGRLSLG